VSRPQAIRKIPLGFNDVLCPRAHLAPYSALKILRNRLTQAPAPGGGSFTPLFSWLYHLNPGIPAQGTTATIFPTFTMFSYTMTTTQTLRYSSTTASNSSHSFTIVSDSSHDRATTSDSSHPIISVESADTAQCHLLSYLGSPDTLDDLRLRIPEIVLFSRPVEKILKSALLQKRRFSYDRETSLLRIYAIARPIHDAVANLVADFLMEAVATGFIMPEERKYISCHNAGVRLSKSKFNPSQKTKKRPAWTKFPDATIQFRVKRKLLPSVVFEVGFSENYSDLVSDAKQWLEKSRGKTRLVILVNVEEDNKSRKARLSTNEAKRRIRDLVARFGNAEGKRREGIDDEVSDVEPDVEPDVEFDADSDADLYDEIEAAIVIEDWVGPISATLEVWHMVDRTPKRRGPPIVRPHYSYV